MIKKRIILIVTVCAIILLPGGCQRNVEEPEMQERIVLGFSQLGDESEWRTASTSDIRRAADEAGVQLMFENAQQQQFNQIRAIRSFILKGVDIIAFCPIVEDGWENILEEAQAANIPVIVVDRKIQTEREGLYTAFIGANFHREGVYAGEWMVQRFEDEPGPVRVAEISGTLNSSPTIGRYEGIREVFRDHPKFEIVVTISGDFMRSKGRECMTYILEKEPDIDILFAHNDDMALGAIEILEDHGIRPGVDIIIVSVDAQTTGLEELREGTINCLTECSPYVGDALMELVFKIVNNEPFPKYTYTETEVFSDCLDPDELPVRPPIFRP